VIQSFDDEKFEYIDDSEDEPIIFDNFFKNILIQDNPYFLEKISKKVNTRHILY
jgi:hypothetical protein